MTSLVSIQLSLIHRELRFIARTLARLRHRHHATLVFSSSKSAILAPAKSTAPKRPKIHRSSISATVVAVITDLLPSPRRTNSLIEDIESMPLLPPGHSAVGNEEYPPATGTMRSPSFLRSGLSFRRRRGQADSGNHESINQTLQSTSPAPTFPPPQELVTISVGAHNPAIFTLQRKHLSNYLSHRPLPPNADSISNLVLEFPTVVGAHFNDLVTYHSTGRIIQYPHHNIEWVVKYQVRILLAAFALGGLLCSDEYQRAAGRELAVLVPLVQHPEEVVDEVFAATKGCATPDGLQVRRMVLEAVMAAARGARLIRAATAGCQIHSEKFWEMYSAACKAKQSRDRPAS